MRNSGTSTTPLSTPLTTTGTPGQPETTTLAGEQPDGTDGTPAETGDTGTDGSTTGGGGTGQSNYGSTESKGLRVVPSEIAGLTRLMINLQSSAKSRQITRKFANSARRNILAMQAPQKTMPKYVEPAENRIIDEQISNTLNRQYAYSDPVLRERMRDKDLATANYLNTQKSANSSQAFNHHLNLAYQINDENSAAIVNLNNTVLQSLNGIGQMEMNSELASNNTATTS
jgi:hypothetical protein